MLDGTYGADEVPPLGGLVSDIPPGQIPAVPEPVAPVSTETPVDLPKKSRTRKTKKGAAPLQKVTASVVRCRSGTLDSVFC